MAVETTIVRDATFADATPRPAEPVTRRRDRSAGELLLLIGAVAIGGPLALALAGVVLLLAVALAGPFFLGGILALAFAVVAVLATGATG
jgi:hypothetical protein